MHYIVRVGFETPQNLTNFWTADDCSRYGNYLWFRG